MAERYPCACCGFRTMDYAPPGTYGTCPVCGWTDDPLDSDEQRIALQRAQVNYAELGAADLTWLDRGRAPRPDERRDPSWTANDDAVRGRDAARKALVQQIHDAFGAVTGEGRISLRQAFRASMDTVAFPIDWDDRDTRWTDIPPEVLEAYATLGGYSIVFPWGNAASYRYYLPAYMLLGLRTYPTAALGALRHRTVVDQHRELSVVELFDGSQRDAVRAFLRYVATYGPSEAEALELEERWRDAAPAS